jgi:hypothetical protein
MLGLSWWFMGWNLVTSLLLASDVVVLGLLNSVESVTNYTLTRYVPETLIGVIVIVVFGIMPGLGGIIGSGDFERAVRLRSEINTFIWLVATSLGVTILIWNRIFIDLWVGAGYYAGALPNLLMIISAMQLVLIRSDGNIIDLTLHLSQKVLLGVLSVSISIGAASILVGIFKLGIVGLCLGIMGGRLIISIGYPLLINRFLNISISQHPARMLRPVLVTMLLLCLAASLDKFVSFPVGAGLTGWVIFFLAAGCTGILTLLISFYAGLSTEQRGTLIKRVLKIMAASEPGA